MTKAFAARYGETSSAYKMLVENSREAASRETKFTCQDSIKMGLEK
jgi:hypothetical protein